MGASLDESAAVLVEKIEKLLDEVRHMDRRTRQQLHDDGVDEEQLLALRAALGRAIAARSPDPARRDRRP